MDADPSAGSAPTQRRGRQHASTRQRREDIVAAASEVFATRGYSNGALSHVATLAGISAPTILHHFGSKTGLLTAVLEQRDHSGFASASSGRSMTGQEFLDHLVDTVRQNTLSRGTTQLYVVLSADSVTDEHPAQAWFRQRYAGLRPLVVNAVAEVTSPWHPTPEAVDETATAIVAVMDGLQVQWLLDPEAVDMVGSAQRTIDALVNALRTGRPVSRRLASGAPTD